MPLIPYMMYWLSKHNLSFFFILLLVFPSFSQIENKELFIKRASFSTPQAVFQDSLTQITAVAIRAGAGSFFVRVEGRWLEIPAEPDAPVRTWFLSLPQPVYQLEIRAEDAGQYEVIAIKSGKSPSLKAKIRTNADPCTSPLPMILQDQWRNGLPPPNYNRSFTQVRNIIVHHAAGSNSATNYTQVVRYI